jgi:hypothetical protein
MKKFAHIKLQLNKNIKKGDKESLLSLFSVTDRFKYMKILTDADEDTTVKVILNGLGNIDLKLGDDMEEGQKKTIMTLFWFDEKSKLFAIERDAEAGEKIKINIWK